MGIKMRIAICDDEPLYHKIILEYLQPYLLKNSDISVEVFSSGNKLIEAYNSGNRYDLMFLDVEMPGLLGVEVAQIVKNIDNSIILIFITAYTRYVKDAFCINAFQCLLKPITREVFNEEFERALNCYRKMKSKYSITYNDKTRIFEVKDIAYIETFHRRLRLSTLSENYEYVGNIGVEEKRLANYGFIRCHQGYLVNMHCICQMENNCFTLPNQIRIPISKHLKSYVLLEYNSFILDYCL